MGGTFDDIINNVTKNKEDYVQDEGDLILQITTSENQKNNNNKNLSTIDLRDCEKKLKDVYDINETIPLLILKVDYYSKDTLIPIVAYEIYNPLNKSKLNLKYCEDILIKLNIPVNIDEENLFKYDPNNEYYTDNCLPYTTINGTDIILDDRQNEFEENNFSLCENNCKYAGLSSDNKQSSCDCKIKSKLDIISEITNPNKLAIEFLTNESSSSNIISVKCTKVLFTKEGLKHNISSYVLLIIILYFLLSIILFIKCGYSLIEMDIDNIIQTKEKEINKSINKQIKNSNNKKRRKNANKIKSGPPKRKINLNFINNVNKSKKYYGQTRSDLNFLNNNNNINNDNIIPIRNTNIINDDMDNKMISSKKKRKKKDKDKITFIKKDMNDYELNTLNYFDALKYDKRTCFEYYISLIRIKHPVLFGFCPIKDYNTIIIKSDIFFLSFAVYYAMNFVFFNENVIHKIYEDGGKYDLVYFLPQICMAFSFSHIVYIIIKLIFLSERNVLKIKIQPTQTASYDIVDKVKRNLTIKYSFFFILGIIFLGIFWLFLSSFGAVYQNTQYIVFENALISFAISFVYPFFINIVPCIFRMCSLSSETQNLGCIYGMSKFFQII